MTVAQVIQAVDAVKPNAFSNEEKTRWLNEVEGMVQTEVLLFASEEVTYSYEQDKDVELLAQPPHDKLYPAYGRTSVRWDRLTLVEEMRFLVPAF